MNEQKNTETARRAYDLFKAGRHRIAYGFIHGRCELGISENRKRGAQRKAERQTADVGIYVFSRRTLGKYTFRAA